MGAKPLLVGLAFGALTVGVAEWTARTGSGLLQAASLPGPVGFVAALVLLDGWMYVWHRLNHRVPLLWRFHRMHHSDPSMDVTTAARFHLGELAISAGLRLGVIVALGIDLLALIVYDTIMAAMVQLQHADVDIGARLDRWLRAVLVTPRMHKIHHSTWRPETDSNYSTVLSVWDRVARTFRMREDPRTLTLGLDELRDRRWQTFAGLWATPFRRAPRAAAPDRDGGEGERRPRAAVPSAVTRAG